LGIPKLRLRVARFGLRPTDPAHGKAQLGAAHRSDDIENQNKRSLTDEAALVAAGTLIV
jgi:hypothetical protein